MLAAEIKDRRTVHRLLVETPKHSHWNDIVDATVQSQATWQCELPPHPVTICTAVLLGTETHPKSTFFSQKVPKLNDYLIPIFQINLYREISGSHSVAQNS